MVTFFINSSSSEIYISTLKYRSSDLDAIDRTLSAVECLSLMAASAEAELKINTGKSKYFINLSVSKRQYELPS